MIVKCARCGKRRVCFGAVRSFYLWSMYDTGGYPNLQAIIENPICNGCFKQFQDVIKKWWKAKDEKGD